MTLHITDAGQRVTTRNICPPIPCRSHDWCAYADGGEEGGGYGYGPTEEEAIRDYLEQIEGDRNVTYDWTKGPWRVAGEISARYLNGIGDVTMIRRNGDNDDRYIALASLDAMGNGIVTSDAERAANARLIAAAPALAEALEPFAEFAELRDSSQAYRLPDDTPIYEFNSVSILMGDCRRAREALSLAKNGST